MKNEVSHDDLTPVVPMQQSTINRLMKEEELRRAEFAIFNKLEEEDWVIAKTAHGWTATRRDFEVALG